MQITKLLNSKDQVTPFSNGSEAVDWYCENCDSCTKAFIPKDMEYPDDKTTRSYIRSRKECHMKYFIDYAFVSGKIPMQVWKEMGNDEKTIYPKCIHFSDNDNDSWQPPKRPVPEDPDQLCLSLGIGDVFKKSKTFTYKNQYVIGHGKLEPV